MLHIEATIKKMKGLERLFQTRMHLLYLVTALTCHSRYVRGPTIFLRFFCDFSEFFEAGMEIRTSPRKILPGRYNPDVFGPPKIKIRTRVNRDSHTSLNRHYRGSCDRALDPDLTAPYNLVRFTPFNLMSYARFST